MRGVRTPALRPAILLATTVWTAALLVAGSGCATTNPRHTTDSALIHVVAAENMWGDLATQLGGGLVEVRSIIANPNVDPHEYEPVVADARAVSDAALVIVNGVGYDPWAQQLVMANPKSGRHVLDVGTLVHIGPGGNPHRWYAPDDVRRVIDQITHDYQAIDSTQADVFAQAHDRLIQSGLVPYYRVIAQIRAAYAGTAIGASESIAVPLADALGLRLITPVSLLNAISEGVDPRTTDLATADRQIAQKQIKLYVYNSQNTTSDVSRQVAAARAAGIPVVAITETLPRSSASFQAWQVAQLTAVQQALAAP
jgi:zinc/manganese transport system substrate-binding protein